ncbi:Uncharacterised protein [Kingella potus]|uniref:Uncharacterized protein n=1 Tax=Kingella potus TaxID=265175 RepID=A0A377R4F9_9NEIS|nr:hypothetical protein [Kingella potus]STR03159.1 Uncharacterised protein [Kingella potus]
MNHDTEIRPARRLSDHTDNDLAETLKLTEAAYKRHLNRHTHENI